MLLWRKDATLNSAAKSFPSATSLTLCGLSCCPLLPHSTSEASWDKTQWKGVKVTTHRKCSVFQASFCWSFYHVPGGHVLKLSKYKQNAAFLSKVSSAKIPFRLLIYRCADSHTGGHHGSVFGRQMNH